MSQFNPDDLKDLQKYLTPFLTVLDKFGIKNVDVENLSSDLQKEGPIGKVYPHHMLIGNILDGITGPGLTSYVRLENRIGLSVFLLWECLINMTSDGILMISDSTLNHIKSRLEGIFKVTTENEFDLNQVQSYILGVLDQLTKIPVRG